MTDQPQPDAEALKIEQIDRDAAAPWVIVPENQAKIRRGEMDWNPLVQAFARHRIARAPEPSGDGEMLTAEGFAQRALAGDRGPASPTDNRSPSREALASDCLLRHGIAPDWYRDGTDKPAVHGDDLIAAMVEFAALKRATPAVDELASYAKFDGVGPHAETIETRACIGESYLEAYESALSDPRLKGYTPADCPSELLLDILNSWQPIPDATPAVDEALAQLFALQVAARVHIDSVDENDLDGGATLEDLRDVEKQASDYLESLPIRASNSGLALSADIATIVAAIPRDEHGQWGFPVWQAWQRITAALASRDSKLEGVEAERDALKTAYDLTAKKYTDLWNKSGAEERAAESRLAQAQETLRYYAGLGDSPLLPAGEPKIGDRAKATLAAIAQPNGEVAK